MREIPRITLDGWGVDSARNTADSWDGRRGFDWGTIGYYGVSKLSKSQIGIRI